jgi:acyl carrier protein
MDRTDALVREIAGILTIDPAQLSPDTPLEGVGWDSVAVLSTIALIDEQYGITVSGDALARCGTVREIAELVGKG